MDLAGSFSVIEIEDDGEGMEPEVLDAVRIVGADRDLQPDLC